MSGGPCWAPTKLVGVTEVEFLSAPISHPNAVTHQPGNQHSTKPGEGWTQEKTPDRIYSPDI